jgi:hypothetical protein
MRVIDKSRLKTYVCSIYKNEMKKIDAALLISVGITAEGFNEHAK